MVGMSEYETRKTAIPESLSVKLKSRYEHANQYAELANPYVKATPEEEKVNYDILSSSNFVEEESRQ